MLTLAAKLIFSGSSFLAIPGRAHVFSKTGADTMRGVVPHSGGFFLAVESGSPGITSIISVDLSGGIIWQKAISVSGYSVFSQIALHPSGDLIVIFRPYNGNAYVGRISSANGSFVWQKTLSHASLVIHAGVAVDTSGNVFFLGYVNAATSYLLYAKFTADGELLWQKKASSSGVSLIPSGIACDASGNVLLAAQNASSVLLRIYTTHGALVSQKTITKDTSSYPVIAVDGDGAIYIAFKSYSTTSKCVVMKFASDLSQVWNAILSKPGGAIAAINNVVIDGSSLYLAFGSESISLNKSTGAVQWQRAIASDYSAQEKADYVGVMGGDVFIAASPSAVSTTDPVVIKAPVGGGATGDYGYLTYKETTNIDASTTTISVSTTSGVIDDTGDASVANGSATLSNSSFAATNYFRK